MKRKWMIPSGQGPRRVDPPPIHSLASLHPLIRVGLRFSRFQKAPIPVDDQTKPKHPGPHPERDPFPKLCPKCGETFPLDITACPQDGTRLVEKSPAEVPAPSPGPYDRAPRSATLVVGADSLGGVPPEVGDPEPAGPSEPPRPATAPEPPPEPPSAPGETGSQTDVHEGGPRDPAATPPLSPSPGTAGGSSPAAGGGVSPETPRASASVAPAQPAEPADRLVGQLLRNKWKVLERVGSGSFGTVYKVQDVKGGWIDALKILSVDRLVGMDAEHARKRFLREAQLVKRLGKDSSHIVGLSTYEEDLEAGLIYFLMDFVEGDSLGEAVRTGGPFSPERTVHLALQVCEALMVAHEGGEPVVHRDLKLENVMITKGRGGEEIAKVLDFGIAKIAEREQDSRLTEAGTSLGTPGFAAPEQLRAAAVDARTDLFAFGVILYTILTGKDPWLGEPAGESTGKIYELMVASERGEVRPFEETGVEVPPALAEITLKLLRREPDERFSSARELKAALEAVPLSPAMPVGDRRAAPKSGRVRRAGRTGSRLSPPLLAGGAVGVLLVLGLVMVRPWGRTLELSDLRSRAAGGEVTRVRVAPGGIEGRLSVLGFLPGPFRVSVGDPELPGALAELRRAGVEVDATWALDRLLQDAVQAQSAMRYFGSDGDDVRGYAERMTALEPGSPEARSLILKVAERMAWDAEAAFQAGAAGVAQNLLRECLALVPNHPRCEAVAAGG